MFCNAFGEKFSTSYNSFLMPWFGLNTPKAHVSCFRIGYRFELQSPPLISACFHPEILAGPPTKFRELNPFGSTVDQMVGSYCILHPDCEDQILKNEGKISPVHEDA